MNSDLQDEIEALESIYPDEFQLLSPYKAQLDISDWSDSSFPNLNLHLQIEFPETYPNDIPIIDYTLLNQEEEEEEEQEILTYEDLENLKTKVELESKENVGMAMIFTLVEFIKEELPRIYKEKQDIQEQIRLEKLAKLEQEELARKQGTICTIESFNAWLSTFLQEIKSIKNSGGVLTPAMEAIAAGSKLFQVKSLNGKLNGRQLFEKDVSLATADMAFLDENDVAVDITLFDLENLGLEEDEENQVLMGLSDEDV